MHTVAKLRARQADVPLARIASVECATAFPSLSRRFVLAVLESMRLLVRLIRLVRELDRDLGTGVVLNGEEVCRINFGEVW